MSLDQAQAREHSIRLASSFPNSRVTPMTMEEWDREFVGMSQEQADSALELIKAQFDKPPTIREIRRCTSIVKHRQTGFSRDDGVNSPCRFCREPVLNGPDAASRFDKDTGMWTNVHLSCAEARHG